MKTLNIYFNNHKPRILYSKTNKISNKQYKFISLLFGAATLPLPVFLFLIFLILCLCVCVR